MVAESSQCDVLYLFENNDVRWRKWLKTINVMPSAPEHVFLELAKVLVVSIYVISFARVGLTVCNCLQNLSEDVMEIGSVIGTTNK